MFVKISIHALLAESDALAQSVVTFLTGFLSTLSLRRATYPAASCRPRGGDFYPRSPCGERPAHWLRKSWESKFLSTLSLRRATVHTFYRIDGISIFLSTLSLRRATYAKSVHDKMHRYFYPRSPCGERRCIVCYVFILHQFLSTLSLRRATISARFLRGLPLYFYPRSPCGERLVQNQFFAHYNLFLSTLSLRRATCSPGFCRITPEFLSTLSLRRATGGNI